MIWLLRLEWAGRIWYLASQSCEPEYDGTPLPHTGTLTCDGFAEAISMGGEITGPCSASVRFHLPGVDVEGMVLQGHHLDTMRGTLALWTPGETYRQATALVYGSLTVDTIPGEGEEVEGTLTQAILETADAYPPESSVADETTWAGLPDDSDGTAYPFPIGNLGAFQDSAGTTKYGSAYKIIMLDVTAGAEIGLIAGAPISASTVQLYNETDGFATFNVTTDTDLLGNTVSIVDFTGSAWVPDGTFDIYVVDLQGGIAKSHGSGAITGLGDAALHLLLQRYSEEGPEAVDVGRWVAALPFLNAWEVGFVIEPGDDPLDIIADKLCTMCPALWIMPGPAGLRPVYLADSDPATCIHLEVGRNCDESDDSEMGYLDSEVYTSVAVSFAESVRLNKFRGKVTIDRGRDVRAAAGYTRHGARALEVQIASYNRGTAGLTASEYLRLYWTRPVYTSIVVDGREARHIPIGTKVRHTNARKGIAERPLYVQGRQVDEDPSRWVLTLIGWW
jgi:hypothetical protein